MSEVFAKDLVPGTNYAVQVRAVSGGQTSEWSPVFNFTTESPSTLPKTPTGVSVISVGDSFHVEWTSVTQNVSNANIAVSRYEVELTGSPTAVVAFKSVPQATETTVKMDLTFEENVQLFGSAKAGISVRIRAVDNSEVKSAWSTATSVVTNPAPSVPTGLTVGALYDAVSVHWTDNSELDTDQYLVEVSQNNSSPGAWTPIYQGPNPATTYLTTTYGTDHWFRVSAIDKFGTSSTPAISSSIRPKSAGADASTIYLTATTQVLNSPSGGGTTTPATSTVTGTAVNTTITSWQYSVDGAAFSSTVPTGVSRTGNVVTITGSTMTARTIAVKMADATGVSDTLTASKVFDGATGSTGGTGPSGADAYTVLLSNESHTFPGSTTAALAGSAVSQIIAYKAATQIAATIGTITGQVTGLTTSIQNNGTTTAQFTVTVTTSLTTQSGVLTVPLTVDGNSFTQTFSWAVSRTGVTGVGVTSITPYYAQVTAGASAPAQPTTSTPSSPWVSTEPGYVTNTDLYTTSKVSYSDSTFSYTTVVKSSTYEAVKSKNAVYYQPTAPTGLSVSDVGDLWFDTDDSNRRYIWVEDPANAGTYIWFDATFIDLVTSDRLNQLESDVTTATGAGTAALEAVGANDITIQTLLDQTSSIDGRISTSDYDPGPEDESGRLDGSLWLTRTRARVNLAPNPSFEVNLTPTASPASGVITTRTRVADAGAVDGDFVMEVANDANVGSHYVDMVTNNAAGRVPVSEGSSFTWSFYAKLVSGAGTTLDPRLYFYQSDGTTQVAGQPVSTGVTNPVIGTTDWVRISQTVVVPTGGVSALPRIVNDTVSTTYRVDAFLFEESDILGGYFDGDTYDCIWGTPTESGTANNSISTMIGGKIIRLWELDEGGWFQRWWNGDLLVDIDASTITGGILNGLLLGDRTVPIDKLQTTVAIASESLAAGDFVNVYSLDGVFQVRKANASNGRECHGFVTEAYSVTGIASVYSLGYNPFLTGLSPGTQYLSATTAGKCTAIPPSSAGQMVQRIGVAVGGTAINFMQNTPVYIN